MSLLTGIFEKLAAVDLPQEDGDYIGEDGLLYCGKCHTRKQRRVEYGGKVYLVRVLCLCETEERDRREEEERRREEEEVMRIRKGFCIHDRRLLDCTFENDAGILPQLKSARIYVDTWPERLANNDGLMLWGDVGTGKSFYAACIANALIERGVPVLMTSFPKILNGLSGFYSEDKNEFIASMMRYDLLVIDDFGVERDTEYALEQVFHVIDERYKTGKPLILTTNLSLSTLKNPPDLAHRRIYDRVLSMCVPVRFSGKSYREAEKAVKVRSLKELFGEEEPC